MFYNTFQWAGEPLPVGDLNPHLLHGSLGPPESTLQSASRSVHPFCSAHGCDQQTHIQTHRR